MEKYRPITLQFDLKAEAPRQAIELPEGTISVQILNMTPKLLSISYGRSQYLLKGDGERTFNDFTEAMIAFTIAGSFELDDPSVPHVVVNCLIATKEV